MAKNHSTPEVLKLPYFVADAAGKYRTRKALTEDQILKAAAIILNKTVAPGWLVDSPGIANNYLQIKLRNLEYEAFYGVFLNNKNRVIQLEELSRGTIDSATVYPREVVKRALALNAAAVIFAHNHPSGVTEPSLADKRLTKKLKEALETVDIRTIDHLIIGNGPSFSFADNKLL
ncbi:MAG: DNA repair protein RadC [Methylobacter sp.]|nr:MAG: DNA repair protein RadC [Methylobacter sp.]PPD19218.1 MAG: DNA repair protein RadC [Methylobacter sp.]PPD36816.1 MAG: DNA repair protein RadC [Methylomonas sp.]